MFGVTVMASIGFIRPGSNWAATNHAFGGHSKANRLIVPLPSNR